MSDLAGSRTIEEVLTSKHNIETIESIPKQYNLTKEQAKKMKFIRYTAGLDTSYSTETSDTCAMIFGGLTNKSEFVVLDEFVIKMLNTYQDKTYHHLNI